MARWKKITLGVATLWLPVYLLLFMLTVFGLMATPVLAGASGTEPNGEAFGQVFGSVFVGLFVGHFCTIFLAFGLVAFYLVHVFRTDRIREERKALWAVVLLMFGMFAMPVYFYLYIWREPSAEARDGSGEPTDGGSRPAV